MKDLKLVGGDFQFDGQNNLQLVDGDDEFLQVITEILTVNTGEWFLNPSHGFNRFEIIGEKHERERTIDTLFQAMLQEPRIDRVENIEFDFDRANRQLVIKYAVVKVTGETVEGGIIV